MRERGKRNDDKLIGTRTVLIDINIIIDLFLFIGGKDIIMDIKKREGKKKRENKRERYLCHLFLGHFLSRCRHFSFGEFGLFKIFVITRDIWRYRLVRRASSLLLRR